ncbi:MAG: M3 family oligoendopeptidase, partial [Clostridia bacterium]|nr:M3 family oligoendopeptidase [Clostridia bacterium]
PYERIDIIKVTDGIMASAKKLREAKDISESSAAISDYQKILSHTNSMATLAMIRHTIDTADKFYDGENDFYDENSPVIEESDQEFTKVMLESPLRPQLEEKYGKLLFINAELSNKCFKPEIIPDLQEENRLESEYQKLIASAQIDFQGETLNLSQLAPYKENSDREVRRAAFLAESEFYMSHAQELDRIFDSLIKCRTKIAKMLGFESFTQLAYCRRTRN